MSELTVNPTPVPNVTRRRGMVRSGLMQILIATLLLTGLNAIKPPMVDDGIYIELARHISTHFSDPYGFDCLWFQWKEPAIQVTSPIIISTWLAVCIRLFGDGFVLMKLWMLPWIAIFAWSLWRLLGRWMATERVPIFWMTILSAFVLPSINLMLDFPTVALTLASLCVMTDAIERSSTGRSSIGRTLLAGLLAGMAMQVKYTGFIAPAVLLIYSIIFLRIGAGLTASLVAGLFFAAWEYVILQKYGTSFFIESMSSKNDSDWRIPLLFQGILTITGLLGSGIGLLALRVFKPARWVYAGVSVMMISTLLIIGWRPVPAAMTMAVGSLILIVIAGAILPLPLEILRDVRRAGPVKWLLGMSEKERVGVFLLAWLGLEIVMYFAISPFPATRRFIEMSILLSLLIGYRLHGANQEEIAQDEIAQHKTGQNEASQNGRWRWSTVAITCGIGLVIGVADIVQGWQYRWAFDQVAMQIRQVDSDLSHRVYCNVLWSGKYDGPRTGMIEAVPEETMLKKGDWLVVSTRGFKSPQVLVTNQDAQPRFDVAMSHPWHINMLSYYAGLVPLVHESAPIVILSVVQATRDFPLRTPPSQAVIETYAKSKRFTPNAGAILFFADAMLTQPPETRNLLAGKIASAGPRRFVKLLNHPDPRIRAWVLTMLDDPSMSPENFEAVRAELQSVADHDPVPTLRDAAKKILASHAPQY